MTMNIQLNDAAGAALADPTDTERNSGLNLPEWAQTRCERLSDDEVITIRLGDDADLVEVSRLATGAQVTRRAETTTAERALDGSSLDTPREVTFVATITVEDADELIAYADHRQNAGGSAPETQVVVREDWKWLGIERLLERRIAEFTGAPSLIVPAS